LAKLHGATASTAVPDKNRVPAIDRETKSINPNQILDRINGATYRPPQCRFC